MRNIKLTIEYDGENYHGWQTQPNLVTVQKTIEGCISGITREKIRIQGSGRTDSGVHALGQVANFKTETHLKISQIQKALNSTLPRDISISKVEEMPEDFHAQFSCQSKVYQYNILNRTYPSAILRNRVWFVPQKLNTNNMKEACTCLIGEHDFAVFAKSDPAVKTTVRKILHAGLKKTRGNVIEFEVEANGFLKRMVRMITGTLVQVGREKITPLQFSEILQNGIKNRHVISAPPQGLFLKKVKYK